MSQQNQFFPLMDFTGRSNRVNEFMLGFINACYTHGILVNGVVWEVAEFDESAPILIPREGADEDEIQRLTAFNHEVRLLCLRNRFQLDVAHRTLNQAPTQQVSLVHLCFIEPHAA